MGYLGWGLSFFINIDIEMSGTKVRNSAQNFQTKGEKGANKSTSLELVFKTQSSLAWDVLDSQSLIYTETDVSLDKITHLTTLYMRIIEKLNCLQDPREQYFSYKMQKLMSEPYIIRCFNNQHQHKRNALEDRRKVLEQKIEQEAERQNHRKIVEKTLEIQNEKEERLRNKIKNVIEEADKKLEERIRRRTMNKLQRSVEYSPNTSLQLNNTSLEKSGSLASSGGSMRNRFLQSKSSDFQLVFSEDERFRELKRELQQEQREERQARKVFGNLRIGQRKT